MRAKHNTPTEGHNAGTHGYSPSVSHRSHHLRTALMRLLLKPQLDGAHSPPQKRCRHNAVPDVTSHPVPHSSHIPHTAPDACVSNGLPLTSCWVPRTGRMLA
jgi:hypothetical protein